MNVGTILKSAREARQVSQLELALRLNVSQRHLSFVENGRARPSRDLIVNWTQELNAPKSLRNAALLHAGFSVVTGRVGRQGTGFERPIEAHGRVLDAHDPWPGMIFNSDWRMLRLNAGAAWLFSRIMPEYLASLDGDLDGWDMIAGIAHEGGLLARMTEPSIIGARLLGQLRLEMLIRPALTKRVEALEAALQNRYGDLLEGQTHDRLEPGLDLHFTTPQGPLSFFTVQTLFQLPQDVAPAMVRTGLWFPADATTRDIMKRQVAVLADG
ncbi:MmyB family transcriptional regulator [Tabrizicola sp.]|uniref:helix-turn-helix domain-containing protein n=1 Tax=Tabrizicola sp. TaxID=2005166 RepID=UPI003F2FF3CF